MSSFTNMVALVTGRTSGISLAIAKAFATEGALMQIPKFNHTGKET